MWVKVIVWGQWADKVQVVVDMGCRVLEIDVCGFVIVLFTGLCSEISPLFVGTCGICCFRALVSGNYRMGFGRVF